MRPVKRGDNPIAGDFGDYEDAKTFLVSRLGSGWYGGIQVANYCSYCERPVSTNLAVEHIQPKGLKIGGIEPYRHLQGRWSNFLLACVNCNSTKGDKDVLMSDLLLPDRDNTFVAFEYLQDGSIQVIAPALQMPLAERTLSITGLNRAATQSVDENMRSIALERVGQRMNAWLLALDAKSEVDAEPLSLGVQNGVVRSALAIGFFSIWMKVFAGDTVMRNRLIDAFAGTRGSGCFDPATTLAISPAPNPDNLPYGAKL